MLESYHIKRNIYTVPTKLTAYKKQTAGAPINVVENFIEWDDPYKFFSFWNIIDFLRNFKLTK
jgi:hypothetical protein